MNLTGPLVPSFRSQFLVFPRATSCNVHCTHNLPIGILAWVAGTRIVVNILREKGLLNMRNCSRFFTFSTFFNTFLESPKNQLSNEILDAVVNLFKRIIYFFFLEFRHFLYIDGNSIKWPFIKAEAGYSSSTRKKVIQKTKTKIMKNSRKFLLPCSLKNVQETAILSNSMGTHHETL